MAEDRIAASRVTLSAGRALDLLKVVEVERFSPEPAILESLLQTIVTAISRHDHPGAISALAELIERDPDHASSAVESPAVQPMHHQARELLHRITQSARDEAELVLAGASATALPDDSSVIALAARLIETGQLAGYVRASELCRRLERPVNTRPIQASRKVAVLAAGLWRRTPLLVLLIAWLSAGLASLLIVRSEAAAMMWGIGFLALVIIQFLVTTRNR